MHQLHGEGPTQLPYVTVGSVLEPLLKEEAKNLPNMLNTKTTQLKEGEHGLQKLSKNELAPTVRGKGTILHYEQDRCLNVRETAALQGFPDNFEFLGSTTAMYQMIGKFAVVCIEMPDQVVLTHFWSFLYLSHFRRKRRSRRTGGTLGS